MTAPDYSTAPRTRPTTTISDDDGDDGDFDLGGDSDVA